MRVKDIVIGASYNNVKVIGEKHLIGKTAYFKCECLKCGKEWDVAAKHIGRIKSCYECHCRSRIIDLTNMKFGRLTPIRFVGRKNDRTLWECVCDCGNHTIVGYSNLVSGITKSCGCYDVECKLQRNKDRRKSATSEEFRCFQSISDHPLYGIWSSMVTRCSNPNRKHYDSYGGRGIKVCDRWLGENGFENFVHDMGERPSLKHSIDRIDVNGNYEPSNCRWATTKEQCRNKRTTKYVYLNGNEIPLIELCEMLGLNYFGVIGKLSRGFDLDYIVHNPNCDFRHKVDANKHRNYNLRVIIEMPTGEKEE